MKKLLFTFLAAMCCMAMNAQSTFEVGDIKYSVTGESTVEVVTKNPSYSGSVVIPATVTYPDGDKTYNVTGIGDKAFFNCYHNMSSVTIPEGVTSIGASAFLNCTRLNSITIPKGVTSIGESAFHSCTGLNLITIPEGVTSIGARAFDNTGWYDKQEEGSLLYLCNYLVGVKGTNTSTNIEIKDGTMTIADYALSNCWSLVSITIPKSVTSIGDLAFPANLNSITVDSENLVYDSRNNCNAIIEKATNTLIAGCKKTIIPSDVTSIGNNAFKTVSELKFVTIPSGVTYIGKKAFFNCNGLTEINVLATTPPTLGEDAFYGVKDIPVYVPDVETYTSWGGFTNLKKYVDLPTVKNEAIAEINDAMKDITTFTEAEKQSIQLCKENINAATTFTEIKSNKDAALFIIDLRKYKDEAIAEINDAMKDITTFTEAEEQSIQLCKNNINAATTLKEIETTKEAALEIIELRPFKDKAIADLQTYFFNEEKIANPPMEEYADRINAATTVNEIQSIVNNIKAEINNYTKFTLGEWKYLLDYNDGEYTIVGGSLTFTDKELYQSGKDFTVDGTLTYTRDVSPVIGKWQAWFVPFDLTLTSDDLAKFDAAQVAGVLTDNDGQPVIAFKKMKEDEKMNANIPYVIRPKSGIAQEISLHLLMPEFHSSATTPFVIQSAYDNFTLGGIYEAQQNSNWYALTKDGVFKKMNGTPAPTLQPQRIWMTVTPREDDPYATKSVSTTRSIGTKSTAIPDVIRIVVLGDDGSPEGKSVREAKIINADGQSVNRIQRGQVYRISGNVNE